MINGMRVLEAFVEQKFPDMPTPRYLHQSAAVRIGGHSYLLVIGGKDSIASRQALKTVHKLHIHDLISTDKSKKKEEEKWIECAPMTSGRCLFALTTISNRYVYVYGGISGAQESRPSLS